MSSLQTRINKHAQIVSRFKTLSQEPSDQIEPLVHFIFRLCMVKNYTAAEEILSLITDSEAFSPFAQLSIVWILRSEIAEEMGDLPKALKMLQQSRKYQAKPFGDIFNAFKSFQQRHAGQKRNTHKSTPRPQSLTECLTKNTPSSLSQESACKPPATKKMKNSNHLSIASIDSVMGGALSPIPSIPISPISPLRSAHSRPQTKCTPLTDDFENCLLESERKSKQRQKKYEFRSRKRKKGLGSRSSLRGSNNNNNINTININNNTNMNTNHSINSNNNNNNNSVNKPMANPNANGNGNGNGNPSIVRDQAVSRPMGKLGVTRQGQGNLNLHHQFRPQLSPIMDVSLEANMSMSITPITPNHRQQSLENSVNMDLSGISDISSIANNESVLSEAHFVLSSPDRSRRPPELPPREPMTTPLVPITPHSLSALQSKSKTKTPRRVVSGEMVQDDGQDSDILNISDRFGSIEIAGSPSRRSGKENKSSSSNKKRSRKIRDEEGSTIRMEMICVSPSKGSKYGSHRVVSPVRRSKRIEKIRDEEGTEQRNVEKLLKESNYHYVPNPMLNTSHNMNM